MDALQIMKSRSYFDAVKLLNHRCLKWLQ